MTMGSALAKVTSGGQCCAPTRKAEHHALQIRARKLQPMTGKGRLQRTSRTAPSPGCTPRRRPSAVEPVGARCSFGLFAEKGSSSLGLNTATGWPCGGVHAALRMREQSMGLCQAVLPQPAGSPSRTIPEHEGKETFAEAALHCRAVTCTSAMK